MGISASSFSNNQNYVYRYIPNAFPNTAEISRGAYGKSPSASALSPSSTAYGTNANPSVGGPAYTSSAAVLAQNAVTTSNVVTTSNTVASGTELQNAINTIAQQSSSPRFTSNKNVFTTSTTPAQTQQGNANTFSPVKTYTPSTTSSAIFESKVAITGQNANISAQNAANLAGVNASFNVKVSQQAAQAIQALQIAAASAAAQATNITGRMDGMIPVAAATLSDFSATTSSTASNLKVFDNITETFNHILGGGGHGGGGAMLGQSQSEEEGSQNPKKKKGMDFMA